MEYSAEEIVRIAIDVEEKGALFYEHMAEISKDESSRQLFVSLADQERQHAGTFVELLRAAGEYAVDNSGEGVYDAYFKTISREFIITPEQIRDMLDKKDITPAQALDFAIAAEKNAILTYSALGENLPDDKKVLVSRIIEEERKHYVVLSNLKSW